MTLPTLVILVGLWLVLRHRASRHSQLAEYECREIMEEAERKMEVGNG